MKTPWAITGAAALPRRAFLRDAARWVLLGGLGGLALALARRPGPCRSGACRTCAQYAACARPQKEGRP